MNCLGDCQPEACLQLQGFARPLQYLFQVYPHPSAWVGAIPLIPVRFELAQVQGVGSKVDELWSVAQPSGGRAQGASLDVQQEEFPGAAIVAVSAVAMVEIESGQREVASLRRPGHGGRQV